MDDPQHVSFTEELDSWLRQHFAVDPSETDLINLTPSGNMGFRYYIDNKRGCELYLRLWPDTGMEGEGYWPANTLVIARIEFANTRTGHGRALLDFLAGQAERYGYDKIALECTHDGEGIQGFAKKFGFEYAWPNLERPHSNWISSVVQIAKRLECSAGVAIACSRL